MNNCRFTPIFRAFIAAGLLAAGSSQAGLFKIDFGHIQNEAEIIEYEVDFFDGEEFGVPITVNTGQFPEPLKDWDVIPTWTFSDPNGEVTDGSASIKGTANDDGTEVTWTLRDFAGTDSDVTLTMLDNIPLANTVNADNPPLMMGQIANNPTHEGFKYVDFKGNAVPTRPHIAEIAYDGVLVPFVVKDDYNYRNPDTGGTEVLMRFENLDPGYYNVTVFEGRTTDGNGRRGRLWVGDENSEGGPDQPNTGNYSGVTDGGVVLPWGQPRILTVEIKEGDFLWFAEQEDNSGGISGMIIRSVDLAPPPADITTSKGLFKVDFGHIENEREINDADGVPTGEFPAVLEDWNVIPTWSFGAPNGEVSPDSASLEGMTNTNGDQTTWKLTDFSGDGNENVKMTIMDNAALSAATGQSPATGQIANNPTKELYDAVYDGVLVPAIVKDDYNYRNPDTGGTELLMRFSGLRAGSYNVTVFEGRTTDNNGRFGKVWVDDDAGANAPTSQNTGNYSGVAIIDGSPVKSPDALPRTITVTIAEGQSIWFAEMEDNSGGISGLIIRGVEDVGSVSPVESEPVFTYAEADHGDLSSNAAEPTVIPWAGTGVYEIGGQSKNYQQIHSDPEYFTLTVPTGHELAKVVLGEYVQVGYEAHGMPMGNGGFMGVGLGDSLPVIDSPEDFPPASAALLGGALIGVRPSLKPGEDLLDDLRAPFTFGFGDLELLIPGFEGNLGAGTYTFMLKEGNPDPETADAYIDWSLRLEVVARLGITSYRFDGNNLTIEFNGKLQSSDTIDGPFSPVAGSSSPYTVSPTGDAKFYIAR